MHDARVCVLYRDSKHLVCRKTPLARMKLGCGQATSEHPVNTDLNTSRDRCCQLPDTILQVISGFNECSRNNSHMVSHARTSSAIAKRVVFSPTLRTQCLSPQKLGHPPPTLTSSRCRGISNIEDLPSQHIFRHQNKDLSLNNTSSQTWQHPPNTTSPL